MSLGVVKREGVRFASVCRYVYMYTMCIGSYILTIDGFREEDGQSVNMYTCVVGAIVL